MEPGERVGEAGRRPEDHPVEEDQAAHAIPECAAQLDACPAGVGKGDRHQGVEACGIDLRAHDVRFEEDNWESPTLGAWGIGWQVLYDGLEITQFTYFQQAGGLDLSPISVELTYGLERFAMALQGVDNVYDLQWAPGVTYREVRLRDEIAMIEDELIPDIIA